MLKLLLLICFITPSLSHHTIKLLLTRETSKYTASQEYCGFNHMQHVSNAFMGMSAPQIENKNHFCNHCKHTEKYKEKYIDHDRKDDNVEAIYEEVKWITKALNIVCPTWDEDIRYKNVDETLKWIMENRKLSMRRDCIETASTLMMNYGKQGNVEKMQLMAQTLDILKSEKLRLGWAGIASDFESENECYLDTCFRVVNAFTYFKPDICSHGTFSTMLQKTCGLSCAKIESRIVENGLNDCCDDCMGDMSSLSEEEKDLIDIHPFNEWKEII